MTSVTSDSRTSTPSSLYKHTIKKGLGLPPLIPVFNPTGLRVYGGSALVIQPLEEMEWSPNTHQPLK